MTKAAGLLRVGAGIFPGTRFSDFVIQISLGLRHSSFVILNPMTAAHHNWRKVKNALMQGIACFCAALVIVPLALIFYYVLKSGIGAVNWDFLTRLPGPVGEAGGGMANALVGTLDRK